MTSFILRRQHAKSNKQGSGANRYPFAGVMRQKYGEAFGVVTTVFLGWCAWRLSYVHQTLDSLVVGLFVGLAAGFFIRKDSPLSAGFESGARVFIPLGIVFYATNLKIDKLSAVPPIAWLQLLVGIMVIFVAAVWAGRKLGLSDKAALQIAVGTAICGASAIVIATPALKARKEDTSLALLSIAVLGVCGMFAYPAIQARWPLSETSYALLTGTTLHMTGFVKVAAAAGGAGCLALATLIKLARTATLLVILPLLSLLAASGGAGGSRLRIPYVMATFIGVSLAFSFLEPLRTLGPEINRYATLSFTIALTSVGLSTDVRAIAGLLPRGLACAAAAWLAVIAVFAAGALTIGY